jgi:spore coat protein A
MPAPTGGPTPATDPTRLTKFLDPLRLPRVLRPDPQAQHAELHIEQVSAQQRLHSQLPPTPLWTYQGDFPGPTIEVRRGQRLRVTWSNRINTPFPVIDGTVPGNDAQAANVPGIDPSLVNKKTADLPPWVVTHLHGARTGAGNDGWTENSILPGSSQLCEYPNDQAATALWYHDHAMGITRLNVQTGLAGMYLIRDDEEDALGLPAGPYEVPLVLCDRNLALDAADAFTGQLLHKSAVFPFFGPYTVVNGGIWPYLEVSARWYRFRVLNASNTRTYRLHLVDEQGQRVPDAVWQIGTDSGLLGAPIPLPDGGLALMPAERADLLIDFSRLGAHRLRLVSSATEPYAGVPLPAGTSPAQPDPAHLLPEPDIMQFRVADEPPQDRFQLPTRLSPSYVRLTHDTLPPHMHRLLLLAPNPKNVFELWEMEQVEPAMAPAAGGTAIDGIVQLQGADGQLVTYRRLSRTLDDTLNWHVRQDGWENWAILNLSVARHPIHLHLIRFQALTREAWDITGFQQASGGTAPGSPLTYGSQVPVDPSDQGWKDVIQVPTGQVVRIAGQFTGATGRFMYHCHLLAHEDDGMMRPFTVTPGAVMDLTGNGGMGGMAM